MKTLQNFVIPHCVCRLRVLRAQDYDSNDIVWMKDAILEQWDLNKDGRIDRDELTMLLLQQGKMIAQEEGWPSETEDEDDDVDDRK